MRNIVDKSLYLTYNGIKGGCGRMQARKAVQTLAWGENNPPIKFIREREENVTVQEIGQLIGTYGFPIVACVAMGWYVKYITDKNNARSDALNEQHANEMKEVTTAINNNTIALTKLVSKMGGDD